VQRRTAVPAQSKGLHPKEVVHFLPSSLLLQGRRAETSDGPDLAATSGLETPADVVAIVRADPASGNCEHFSAVPFEAFFEIRVEAKGAVAWVGESRLPLDTERRAAAKRFTAGASRGAIALNSSQF
jgi:hypothetical protein